MFPECHLLDGSTVVFPYLASKNCILDSIFGIGIECVCGLPGCLYINGKVIGCEKLNNLTVNHRTKYTAIQNGYCV